jgi:RNA polymerase sigma factor (sigma-70 family)
MATDGGRALQPGHVSEFETFLLASRRRTLLAVLPLVRDFGEAEDVVQVAYERAALRWAAIREYEDPAGWVRRVAYNEAVSWIRRTRRHVVDYVPDLHDVAGQHLDSYDHDEPDLLVALRRLPHRDRVVLTMRYLWEHTLEEIAEELGTSPNTVKARLARARKRLAGSMAADVTAPPSAATAPPEATVPDWRTCRP